MRLETAIALIERVESIKSEVGAMRRTMQGEALAINQRQYLSRCFDLLEMELAALQQYVGDLRDE